MLAVLLHIVLHCSFVSVPLRKRCDQRAELDIINGVVSYLMPQLELTSGLLKLHGAVGTTFGTLYLVWHLMQVVAKAVAAQCRSMYILSEV